MTDPQEEKCVLTREEEQLSAHTGAVFEERRWEGVCVRVQRGAAALGVCERRWEGGGAKVGTEGGAGCVGKVMKEERVRERETASGSRADSSPRCVCFCQV